MSDAFEPAENEVDEQRMARERSDRWGEEITHSGHAYEPTESTQARRDAEISRDDRETERLREDSASE